MYIAHTNAWGGKFDLAIKRSNVNIGPSFLAILVDLPPPPPPIICTKIGAQGLFGFGQEDFKGFYYIWAWQPF